MTTAISNLSATWSNSSITYNAISMNVATNAYESNSKILILKANGVPVMTVDASGIINAKTLNLVNSIGITKTITTVYTTPGVYTHTANEKMIFAQVIATGGGGSSGTAEGTVSRTNVCGAGGAGGTVISYVTKVDFGATAAVIVGAGGTANTQAPNAPGGSGGVFLASNIGGTTTVTFTGGANTMTADGGLGALSTTYTLYTGVTIQTSGTGGSASGGDINLPGANGDYSTYVVGGSVNDLYGGFGLKGGDSYWAKGGRSNTLTIANYTSSTGRANAIATPVISYGAGAGGGLSGNGASIWNSAGANGIVFIEEYLAL